MGIEEWSILKPAAVSLALVLDTTFNTSANEHHYK